MSITIYPLSEGAFTVGHNKIFVPHEPKSPDAPPPAGGSLLVEIQPFLVILDGQHILFDTGLGFAMPGGELQIHQNLRKLGIEASQIQMVILSHLHKDHTGGIGFINSLGIHELSFPNATYYISKNEFSYGMEKGLPSYNTEDFSILKNSPQVEWLESKGIIKGNIHYEESGGHCPFHTTFLIEHQQGKIFFGGDTVPQLRQLKMRYMAKYDFDGKKSMHLRADFAVRGKAEHWTFLFYHDVNHPGAQL